MPDRTALDGHEWSRYIEVKITINNRIAHAHLSRYRRRRLHRLPHRRGAGPAGDRVRVLDNLSTGRLANLDGVPRPHRVHRGRRDRRHGGGRGGRRRGLHLPRGGAGLGAGERRAAVGQPRRLRHRDGDAAGRGPAGGRAAGGLCRLQRRLRRPADQPKRETDLPAPLSPYAAAKLAAEHYCQAFTATYGLETVALRYFNVFGPRQDPDSPYSAVIPLFITAMLAGRQPVIYGDGRQSRDFSFVANVVQANLLAADAPGVAGRVLNVANGSSIDLLPLIDDAQPPAWALNVEPRFAPPRLGDVRESLADITLARKLLGYEPAVDFEEGLRRSIDYYRSIAGQSRPLAERDLRSRVLLGRRNLRTIVPR